MATYLLDTNILLRSCDPGSTAHRTAVNAVAALLQRGDDLCIAPQNVIEFWVVATRPANVNGLGWDPERAAMEVERLLDQFELLDAHPGAFPHWLRLVISHRIRGKRTHDAHLVAMMHAHGISLLLTLNPKDFSSYPGIALVDPGNVT